MTATIAPPNHHEPYPWAPSHYAGQEIGISRSLGLAAVSETSQDITLHTKEGDTVTLSMNRETVAVYGRDARLSVRRYGGQNHEGDRFYSGRSAAETTEWFGLETSAERTISIDGDLSREEMRDIRKALGRIDRLIHGHYGSAADRHAAGLARLDTLSGVEVDVRRSWTMMASRSTGIASLTVGSDAQPAILPEKNGDAEVPAWQPPAEEAIGIVEETGIDPAHFIDPLRDLFSRWTDRLRRHQRALEESLLMMEGAIRHHLEIMPVNEKRPDPIS